MEPTNRQATPGARRLFHDLDSLKGKGILTGQHTQTVKMEEIDEIRKITGKEPALRGGELLAYSRIFAMKRAMRPVGRRLMRIRIHWHTHFRSGEAAVS